VHISELAPRRVQKVTDVVKEGDKVKVKFLGMDERGKVRLSMKVVDQETGEDLTEKLKAERDAERNRERQEAASNAPASRKRKGQALKAALFSCPAPALPVRIRALRTGRSRCSARQRRGRP
jgi:predicted RNA-binding protein with RPS1 domain